MYNVEGGEGGGRKKMQLWLVADTSMRGIIHEG